MILYHSYPRKEADVVQHLILQVETCKLVDRSVHEGAHPELQGDVIDGALAANEALEVLLHKLPHLILAGRQACLELAQALLQLLTWCVSMCCAEVQPWIKLLAAGLHLA